MAADSPQVMPGPDGTPLPDGLRLVRIANQPNFSNLSPEFLRLVGEGKALPPFFELSSEDKRQPIPRLSVWVEQLTTIAQVWELVGANPKRCWVVFLEVDQVRSISAPAVEKLPSTPHLDVQWERAMTTSEMGERIPEMRAGWEGHAGITNLDKGNKTQRDSLRWQLAESATVRIFSADDLAAFRQLNESGTNETDSQKKKAE